MYIDVPHALTVRVVVEVSLGEVVRFYGRWPETNVSISEGLDTKITGRIEEKCATGISSYDSIITLRLSHM